MPQYRRTKARASSKLAFGRPCNKARALQAAANDSAARGLAPNFTPADAADAPGWLASTTRAM